MFSERQKEILSTSVEIIAEKGIQGLTIKNLSKAIGVSEAAIYRHFDSKANILMTILKLFEKESNNFLKNGTDMKPSERIIDFFNKMLTVFQANPSIASVIFAEEIFHNDASLSGLVNSIIKNNQDYINNIIKEGQNLNIYRNDISSDHLTLYISGAMRLLVKDWRTENSKDNLIKKGESLLKTFFNLIKK
ncbi:MAG: TetR/AcrR family transcriptional regulator [Bacteroidales bacterium]|jgi:TetR/AcrR family fatty acid metabolism transcriptional regulator|nr:TetR/AcrR family transcriptional regulator [Bacteroidales bacterium]